MRLRMPEFRPDVETEFGYNVDASKRKPLFKRKVRSLITCTNLGMAGFWRTAMLAAVAASATASGLFRHFGSRFSRTQNVAVWLLPCTYYAHHCTVLVSVVCLPTHSHMCLAVRWPLCRFESLTADWLVRAVANMREDRGRVAGNKMVCVTEREFVCTHRLA